MWDGDILTNPPYKYAKEFIEHAMTIIPDGRKVFMFLKLQFLELNSDMLVKHHVQQAQFHKKTRNPYGAEIRLSGLQFQENRP